MKKPLMKTIQTPYGYYFYDTNTNQILSTNKEIYELLSQLQDAKEENEVDAILSTPEISEIRDRGYLSSFRPSVIRHPATEHIDSFLRSGLKKITLQLTQDCNFRCTYCSYTHSDKQRSHSRKRMSFETAKQALDFFHSHSTDVPKVNVGFYGGEPLLEFELLKKCVAYAEQLFEGKQLTFNMTTNGSIMNDEIMEYLIAHHFYLLISLDGPEEVHDKNRVFVNGEGTFSIVMENLKYINDHYPEYKDLVQINMVIDPSQDYDCYNSFFIEYDAIEKARASSNLVDSMLNGMEIEWNKDFNDKNQYDTFLGYLSYFGRISNEIPSPIGINAAEQVQIDNQREAATNSLSEVMAPSGPCIPGTNRSMITVDGTIVVCEKCSEQSNVMRIGSIYEGYDREKVYDVVNIGALTSEDCRNCWAIRYCTICAARITDNQGNLSKTMKEKLCPDVKRQAKKKIQRRIMYKEIRAKKSFKQEIKYT